MKTNEQLKKEIESLKELAKTVPNDLVAQASIAGQINVLEWATAK